MMLFAAMGPTGAAAPVVLEAKCGEQMTLGKENSELSGVTG